LDFPFEGSVQAIKYQKDTLNPKSQYPHQAQQPSVATKFQPLLKKAILHFSVCHKGYSATTIQSSLKIGFTTFIFK